MAIVKSPKKTKLKVLYIKSFFKKNKIFFKKNQIDKPLNKIFFKKYEINNLKLKKN